MKVLITDTISPGALFVLEAEDAWDIIVSNPTDFTAHLADTDAIVCRSATKITRAVLDQAPKLRAIGRAGTGVDNVDIDAATAKGVVVMNTPGGNAISVAEHTLALMFALARMIAQANESTKAGNWEKKKFMGTELNGKTLGIIGLGNIGMQVARRARPLGMNLIAHDPFVSRELAKDRGVELLTLDELFAKSDYITLHLSATPETHHLLDGGAFAKMKDGVRLVNCARGELVDPDALEAALTSGKVAGSCRSRA